MRRLVMRRLVAALAGTVLTWGIAASPAVAAAPERYTDHFEETDTIDCSEFDPAWTFNDDFVDVFDIRGQVWLNDAGQPVRALEHIVHRSTDVNSVTGLTLHEHNHFTVQIDFIGGTVTVNGAINVASRGSERRVRPHPTMINLRSPFSARSALPVDNWPWTAVVRPLP